MKILDAIQECSGLRVLVEREYHGKHVHSVVREWLNPPEDGLSLEEAERLIEEQGVKVVGRT